MTDPSEFTVAELHEYVQAVDSTFELAELRDAEEAGEDRVTALEVIDERLDAIEAEADESPTDGDESDDEPDVDEAASTDADNTERITVRNWQSEPVSAGKYGFQPGEARRVPTSPEILRAIRRGDLQVVSG